MRYWMFFCGLVLAFGLSTAALAGDGEIVFSGFPFHRVVIEEIDKPRPESIPTDKRQEFAIVIETDGDGFSWTSREGKPLIYAGRSGVFETWVAFDGSGYVRISPKGVGDPTAGPSEYVYVEHLVNKIGSVTYWGFGYLSRPSSMNSK